MASNTRLRSRQSSRLAGEAVASVQLRSGLVSQSCTRRSGSWKGSGFRRTPYTRLNMAVFAPMPSASVSTASAVNAGRPSSVRTPNLRSCQSISTLHCCERSHKACAKAPAARRVAAPWRPPPPLVSHASSAFHSWRKSSRSAAGASQAAAATSVQAIIASLASWWDSASGPIQARDTSRPRFRARVIPAR